MSATSAEIWRKYAMAERHLRLEWEPTNGAALQRYTTLVAEADDLYTQALAQEWAERVAREGEEHE